MKQRASGSGRRERTSDPDDTPTTLGEVYRLHAQFVWRTIRRLGVPESAVEDVMQDVFMVVHRRLREYDGRAAMTTWLFHLTRGVVSNYRRGRVRERNRLKLIEPRANPAPDPQANAERTEAAAFVRRFLATLSPDKCQVFELVEIEGLSVPQVAEMCRINLNTAYSRLRAARREFQVAVSERGGPRRAVGGQDAR